MNFASGLKTGLFTLVPVALIECQGNRFGRLRDVEEKAVLERLQLASTQAPNLHSDLLGFEDLHGALMLISGPSGSEVRNKQVPSKAAHETGPLMWSRKLGDAGRVALLQPKNACLKMLAQKPDPLFPWVGCQ